MLKPVAEESRDTLSLDHSIEVHYRKTNKSHVAGQGIDPVLYCKSV